MKTIYLIRHGENEEQFGDPPLTKKGEQQANRIVLDDEIDIIYTSPSLRAVQTASIINEKLGVPQKVNALLKERLDMTDVPDLAYGEYRHLCYLSANDRNFVLPNGETGYTSGLRLEYLIAVTANQIDSAGVFVTHQGILSDFMRNKFSPEYLDEKYSHYSRVRADAFKNCSITKLLVDGNQYEIDYLASAEHLR